MHPDILRYEDQGFLLHPCTGKVPLLKGWQERASRDREEHRRWFEEEGYNVGLLTGERNGIVVADFDDIDEARKAFPILKPTAISRTPHGAHFFFLHPGGEIKNAVKTRIGNLLADVRGDGGYIVAPPSTTESPYSFVPGFELDLGKLSTFDPKWLIQSAATVTRKEIKSLLSYLGKVQSVEGQGGSRGLVRAAACCRDFGCTESEAMLHMLWWNQQSVVVPPWPEEEIARAVHNVFQKGTP